MASRPDQQHRQRRAVRTAARAAAGLLAAATLYVGPFVAHHYIWTALHP